MCGIAGFITVRPYQINDDIITRMTRVIAHRGPDDCRFHRDAHAHFGHRRLSIIDLASGHQPMPNEDQNVWIVYNGEIFNHSTVRPALERAGHAYRTHCDTETIIHAYEQWGADCLSYFRGMFAFAIWDAKHRKLFAARDRLGIKPFYYWWNGKEFVFASEIKAILQHPSVSCTFEEELLPEYLGTGYIASEKTMFRGIRKLMPGNYLTLDLTADPVTIVVKQYWDVPQPETIEKRDDESWIAECRQRLEETVRLRLMSDVPLGVFLSGGVDSSAIAALVKRMVSTPVKTFSVGYREQQYSELPQARNLAKLIGTQHQEVVVGMDQFFDALPQMVWHEDEPICWPSSISLHFVSQLAAGQVKVVLTGEGSDELFAGYERYQRYLWNLQWMKTYHFVPATVRKTVRNGIAASALISGALRRKAQHTFLGREGSIESLHLDNFYSAFSMAEIEALLRSKQLVRNPHLDYLHYWDIGTNRSTLSKMLYSDQKTYLVELLMKQDQMSMSASIESRVPFLDHTFVEFAACIPDDLKIHKGEQKYILKKAVEDLLPHDIVYRKKMGFPTPLRQWLRDERANRLLSLLQEKNSFVSSFLDVDVVHALIAKHQSGAEDATDRIWRLLNLQIWGDCFITGKRENWQEGLISAGSPL